MATFAGTCPPTCWPADRRDDERGRAHDRARALAVDAVRIMNEAAITVLFVVKDGWPVGAIHLHDCLKAGVA